MANNVCNEKWHGSQAIHISLFLFQNNFNKFDIEQTEYSYQNINNWITKK